MEEQKTINRSIVRFIVSSQSANATVENTEFQEMVTTLNAKAVVPCRKTITNAIQTYTIIIEQKVLEILVHIFNINIIYSK